MTAAIQLLFIILGSWVVVAPFGIGGVGGICRSLGVAPVHRYWLLLPVVGPVILSLVLLVVLTVGGRLPGLARQP